MRFVPTRFTPSSSVHAGKECGGVQIYIDDWRRFSTLQAGTTVAYQLRRLYPEAWQAQRYERLLAHPPTIEALLRGDSPEQIERLWQPDLEKYRKLRQNYLLYE